LPGVGGVRTVTSVGVFRANSSNFSPCRVSTIAATVLYRPVAWHDNGHLCILMLMLGAK